MLFRITKPSLAIFSSILAGVLLFGHQVMAQNVAAAGDGTLGGLIRKAAESSNLLPGFISFLAYLVGVLFVALGVYKLKNHVEYGPQSVALADPLKFLASGGLMLALPSISRVMQVTFGGEIGTTQNIGDLSGTSGVPGTLDAMLVSFMSNTYMPMQFLLTFFCFVAGAALMMVAVHRLTKSAQEGPRGPAGAGTIATFVLAGVLFSIAPSVGTITETLYGGRTSMLSVSFLALGSVADSGEHTKIVIKSILVFMIIVGIISVIRGFFILRGVAEGNQQMTMMGGLSHVIAGALLINFGQFANIIQKTLGLTQYGVNFSI